MPGPQLGEPDPQRVVVEFVGLDHRLLVLVHHSRGYAPDVVVAREPLHRIARQWARDQRHELQPGPGFRGPHDWVSGDAGARAADSGHRAPDLSPRAGLGARAMPQDLPPPSLFTP